MEIFFMVICLSVCMLLFLIFFSFGKMEIYDKFLTNIFECGFSSYFFSRFSFSIQFFLIALIFLFFDLELCCLMPLLQESSSENKSVKMLCLFVFILLIGLMKELKDEKLDWKI